MKKTKKIFRNFLLAFCTFCLVLSCNGIGALAFDFVAEGKIDTVTSGAGSTDVVFSGECLNGEVNTFHGDIIEDGITLKTVIDEDYGFDSGIITELFVNNSSVKRVFSSNERAVCETSDDYVLDDEYIYRFDKAELYEGLNEYEDYGEGLPFYTHTYKVFITKKTSEAEERERVLGEWYKIENDINTAINTIIEQNVEMVRMSDLSSKKEEKDTSLIIKTGNWSSLPKRVMEGLTRTSSRRNVEIVFNYTNQSVVTIIIPKGTEVEITLDWYGPEKLMEMFDWYMVDYKGDFTFKNTNASSFYNEMHQ